MSELGDNNSVMLHLLCYRTRLDSAEHNAVANNEPYRDENARRDVLIQLFGRLAAVVCAMVEYSCILCHIFDKLSP